MMRTGNGIALIVLLVAAVVLLVVNAGDHTWIQSTPGYRILAILVATNTLVFALIASAKMGYRSGRAALRVHGPAGPQGDQPMPGR
jgi:hypothetical protein